MRPISSKICQFKDQALAMILLAVITFSCGGNDPEPKATESEKVAKMLTAGGKTWTLPASGGVTVDGVDVTDDLFSGFSITFGKETFTTTGTSPVWLRQDTWTFKDETAKAFIRGQDQREITITEISDTQLQLTLEWPALTTEGGRQGSLKGKHEFTLNK
jgi:hypothetical protein